MQGEGTQRPKEGPELLPLSFFTIPLRWGLSVNLDPRGLPVSASLRARVTGMGRTHSLLPEYWATNSHPHDYAANALNSWAISPAIEFHIVIFYCFFRFF